MQVEIGQVYEVQWTQGAEALPSQRVTTKTRRAILTGIELEGSVPTKLWFSCPILQGRRSGEVHMNEWSGINAKFLGKLDMILA